MVLLFGRWLLPRGTISREQLSALLISYLSMCADMLDFISVLSEDEIYRNDLCRHLIQIIWIISLFQVSRVQSTLFKPTPHFFRGASSIMSQLHSKLFKYYNE